MRSLFSVLTPLVCLIMLGAHLSHLISVWDKIPDSILLMHSGEGSNQTGPKELLFAVPVIAVLLWFFIFYLKSIRKKFNYVNLTEENKDLQYKAMSIMLMSVQTLSFIGLISINESFLRDILNLSSTIFETAAIVFLILCAVPPIILAIWSKTVLKETV